MHSPALRFGLAGYGPWGVHHAQAIARTLGATLVAIADIDPLRCAAAQVDHPQAVVLADWRELVARTDVDMVDVALPADLHFAAARDAIEAGRHVLIDAPMVARLRQADELIGRACERETMLAVAHPLRTAGVWCKVKEFLDQGLVGRPERVLLDVLRPAHSPRWFDELVHYFDLARWYLLGRAEPESVCARTSPGLGFERFTATVDHQDAPWPEHWALAPASCPQVVCTVIGEGGTIVATWRGGERPAVELRVRTRGETEHFQAAPALEVGGQFEPLMADLVRSIREGRPSLASGVDGRFAVRMGLAAEESLARGGPVRIRAVG